jgi:hypothetical protein
MRELTSGSWLDLIMSSRFMHWRKSSRSTVQAGNCVEVGAAPGQRAVRDTKMGSTSPILVFSTQSWSAFVRATNS